MQVCFELVPVPDRILTILGMIHLPNSRLFPPSYSLPQVSDVPIIRSECRISESG